MFSLNVGVCIVLLYYCIIVGLCVRCVVDVYRSIASPRLTNIERNNSEHFSFEQTKQTASVCENTNKPARRASHNTLGGVRGPNSRSMHNS